jgi:hypothetical protein
LKRFEKKKKTKPQTLLPFGPSGPDLPAGLLSSPPAQYTLLAHLSHAAQLHLLLLSLSFLPLTGRARALGPPPSFTTLPYFASTAHRRSFPAACAFLSTFKPPSREPLSPGASPSHQFSFGYSPSLDFESKSPAPATAIDGHCPGRRFPLPPLLFKAKAEPLPRLFPPFRTCAHPVPLCPRTRPSPEAPARRAIAGHPEVSRRQ